MSRSYFRKICNIVYLMGAPNYYFEPLNLPPILIRTHDYLSIFSHVLVFLLILSEFGAFFTQHNLSGKQSYDLRVFSFCHPLLYSFVPILERHTEKVKYIIQTLVKNMKELYNDKAVEKKMIRKSNVYLMFFVSFIGSALVSYCFDAIVQIYTKGTFIII